MLPPINYAYYQNNGRIEEKHIQQRGLNSKNTENCEDKHPNGTKELKSMLDSLDSCGRTLVNDYSGPDPGTKSSDEPDPFGPLDDPGEPSLTDTGRDPGTKPCCEPLDDPGTEPSEPDPGTEPLPDLG